MGVNEVEIRLESLRFLPFFDSPFRALVWRESTLLLCFAFFPIPELLMATLFKDGDRRVGGSATYMPLEPACQIKDNCTRIFCDPWAIRPYAGSTPPDFFMSRTLERRAGFSSSTRGVHDVETKRGNVAAHSSEAATYLY